MNSLPSVLTSGKPDGNPLRPETTNLFENRFMVNCVIPDEWVTKCMRVRLQQPELNIATERQTLAVRSRRPGANGLWTKGSAAMNPDIFRISLLGGGWKIWIRGKFTMEELQRKAVLLGIAFQVVDVNVRDFAKKRNAHKAFGIAVDLRDAFNLIVALDPEIVDRKRAERYDDDEH